MKKTVISICASLLTLIGYVHGGTAATLKGGDKRLGNSNIRGFASPARQNKASATAESSTPSDTSQKLKFEGTRQKTIDGIEYTYQGYILDQIGGHSIDWSKRPFVLSIDKAEFDSSIEKIKIPDQIDGIPVLRIGTKCFQNCSRIKSVVLPKKILTICESAFEGCRALESVSGLEQCRGIGGYAFKNCNKLKTRIVFEKDVLICGSAFEGCHEIESIEFGGRISFSGITIGIVLDAMDDNIFADCRKLSHFKFPVGVREIHAGAFAGCSSLLDVVIPDSVEKIRSAGTGDLGVFEGCTSLRSVTIPSNVKSVGSNAFKGCSSLKKVVLPFSLKEINSETFEGCSSLESVKIPNAVKSIGGSAFKDCLALTKITIPRNVTEIHVKCFEGCTSLKSVVLPPKLEEISPSVFEGCSSLEEMKLPNVTMIHASAFKDCAGLKSVEMPKVKGVSILAFKGCKSLRSVYMPDQCNCSEGCFEGCDALESVDIPASLSFCKTFKDCKNVVTVNIRGNPREIEGRCFAGLSKLKEFNVPDGVTSIGEFAFSNCTSLASIALPKTLKRISDGAFCGCTGIRRIDIPDGVEAVGFRAFYACANLAEIALPATITSVGQNLFEKCDRLTSIKFSALKRVPDGMFKGCVGLSSISFPDGTESVGPYAFEGCTGLSSVTFPESITSLEQKSFKDCTKLTEVVIPKGVAECRDAFNGCDNLRKVVIGAKVRSICDVVAAPENLEEVSLREGAWKEIPNRMFVGCSNVTEIKIPEGVTRIGWSAFEGCAQLAEIRIPDGVTEIDSDAFKGCSRLASVELPSKLTRVGPGAFMDCRSLTSISLPDGVRKLERKTFAGCSNLKTIKKSAKTVFEDDTFAGCDQLSADDKIDSRKREALKYEKERKARDEELERAQRKMRSGMGSIREMDRKAKSSGSSGMWLVLLLVGGVGGYIYVHSRKHKCSYVESFKELLVIAMRIFNSMKEFTTKRK